MQLSDTRLNILVTNTELRYFIFLPSAAAEVTFSLPEEKQSKPSVN